MLTAGIPAKVLAQFDLTGMLVVVSDKKYFIGIPTMVVGKKTLIFSRTTNSSTQPFLPLVPVLVYQ